MRLMILYTPGMRSKMLDTRLNYLVSRANQAYLDSHVPVALRIVSRQWIDCADANRNQAALTDLTHGRSGFSQIPRLREQFGADLVTLIRPFHDASQQKLRRGLGQRRCSA